MNYKILVVDDEPANTRMLERVLRNHFDVVCAHSGAEALELLNVHNISLIISDQRMPGMTGVEFLKRSAETRPQCVRIILTGYTDAADLVEALNSNVVYKYVTKPWIGTDLLQTVRRGLSHHETLKAQHRLGLETERLRERLRSADDCLVRLCAELVALKDESNRDRAPRIRELAMMVGRALQLDASTLETLTAASSLCGLAELYVPAELSPNRAELTDAEQVFVEECRERALKLLEDAPHLNDAVAALRYLPEHFDGAGFPSGLMRGQIPLISRIIAVVKAFDTMVFPDNGMGTFSREQAIAELQRSAGTEFDPNVIRAFCGLMAIDHIQQSLEPTDNAVLAEASFA